MHPILFHIGSWGVPTYGVFGALAYLAMITFIERLAPRYHLDKKNVSELVVWGCIVAFVGSRTFFFLTQPEILFGNPMAIFDISAGGYVFYGGFLAALPFLVIYMRRHRLPAWNTFDVTSTGLVLAHAISRIGCFGAGCCHGKPTSSILGVRMTSDVVEPIYRGIPLHPTQLYESLALFVLFGVMWKMLPRRRFEGQVVLTYFISYAVIRAVLEFFRGDEDRGIGFAGLLSTSQFISLMLFIGALIAWVLKSRRISAPTVKFS